MYKLVLVLNNTSKAVLLTILFTFAFVTGGFSEPEAGSCAANSANRQFDFWLGNWKIDAAGSSENAHSTVALSLDKCLVVENWDGGRGHRGENVFGYSADDNGWYGMFADNEGRVHVFTSGKVEDGAAQFEGTSRGPNGESVLNRVKVVRIDPNKVEQTWEKSSDNGATWKIMFRGEYLRANP